MKYSYLPLAVVLLALFGHRSLRAQQTRDSILSTPLTEVVLIGSLNGFEHIKTTKLLAGVEDYLESMPSVGMVKRGAYAWEPTLNNMSSERITITIDGMKIFGACTDKMDPITSYVDVSNLALAEVNSGQSGSQFGNAVGGAINLVLDRTGFGEKESKLKVQTAYESNHQLSILGFDGSWRSKSYYLDTNLLYRKAENYKAANKEEVLYAQFSKLNLSLTAGKKLKDGSVLSSSWIIDRAQDVGYPALPMDVSLAQAVIGALDYSTTVSGVFDRFESKLYVNSIVHIMDDSKRPVVPIRMDMPGRSLTFGAYAIGKKTKKRHELEFKWDAFYNNSYADMTMYPNDSSQKAMFMLTWPDVNTYNSGVYVSDRWKLNKGALKTDVRINGQYSRLGSEMGLESLRIFYPKMNNGNSRLLKSIALSYQLQPHQWSYQLGIGYGDRAPSVSEAYGFYLYNSFDNHDYLGNPDLKNEQSIEFNTSLAYTSSFVSASVKANYFRMPNYIIGIPDLALSQMTIGAAGVKQYINLPYAQLYALSTQVKVQWNTKLQTLLQLSYHRSYDSVGESLPFIAPLEYTAEVGYNHQGYQLVTTIFGAGSQVNYNPSFGEDQTKAYTIIDLSIGKQFNFGATPLLIKSGVENLFDTYYTTYSDWNNIPRMGRNLFLNLTYQL